MGLKGILYRKIKEKNFKKNSKSLDESKIKEILRCPKCKKTFPAEIASVENDYMYCPYCNHSPVEVVESSVVHKKEAKTGKTVSKKKEILTGSLTYWGGH